MKEAEVRLYHKKNIGFFEAKLSCVVLRGLLDRYNACVELPSVFVLDLTCSV
jgi:hypothetical protein